MDKNETDLQHSVQSVQPIDRAIPPHEEAPAAEFVGAQEDEIQEGDSSASTNSTLDDTASSTHDDACNP
jgi:hypothetical protein